jgi:hypothetical protein
LLQQQNLKIFEQTHNGAEPMSLLHVIVEKVLGGEGDPAADGAGVALLFARSSEQIITQKPYFCSYSTRKARTRECFWPGKAQGSAGWRIC